MVRKSQILKLVSIIALIWLLLIVMLNIFNNGQSYHYIYTEEKLQLGQQQLQHKGNIYQSGSNGVAINNNTNIKLDFTVRDDLKRVFKTKCKKATGIDNSTLYQEVEKQALNFTKCISSIANLTALQEEIEIARPLGELDTVFHRYCLKVPQGEKCFKDFNSVIQPCLSKREQTQNAIMLRIFSGLLDFMCARGGDQVALFVAEDGPECFEANKEALTHCANRSFSEFIPKDNTMPDLFNLPDFVVEPEHCIDLVKFETCAVHHLENCQEITPANVADSIFRFVKNETGCKNWLENKANARSILKEQKKSTATSGHLSIFMYFLTSLMGLFFKYFV